MHVVGYRALVTSTLAHQLLVAQQLIGCRVRLLPASRYIEVYNHRLYNSFYKQMCFEVCDMNHRDIILGFAAVFLFIKSYASCLVAELSQLCYKGVIRTRALGSTDGLCTYGCPFVMGLH